MTRLKTHADRHLIERIGWLRAAVLGANDGIVSTASLIVGVAAASADKSPVPVAGLAGLVAGAMSVGARHLDGPRQSHPAGTAPPQACRSRE